MDLVAETSAAIEAAKLTGPLLLDYFENGGFSMTSKKVRQDVVTQADLESERMILGYLLQKWPDDGVLAEESGNSDSASSRVWCVDPLDGTANFAAGYPHWAVAIALLKDGAPILAVTFDPLRDEVFVASKGSELVTPAGPSALRRVDQVEDALVADNRPYAHREPIHPLELLLRQSRGRRESGSMALDFAWLAAGRLDAVTYERSDRLWDFIGGELLVTEAGGVLRTADLDNDIVVASCPELADTLCVGKTPV